MLATIVEIKQSMGMVGTTDDDLLTRLSNVMSEAIKRYLSLTRVESGSFDDRLDGTGHQLLLLRSYPVLTLTSVIVDTLAITSDKYLLDGRSLVGQKDYVFPRGRSNVRVQGTSGYTIIPEDLKQVCIDMVAREYKRRQRAGVTTEGIAGLQTSYSEDDILATEKTMLNPYKNVVWP